MSGVANDYFYVMLTHHRFSHRTTIAFVFPDGCTGIGGIKYGMLFN